MSHFSVLILTAPPPGLGKELAGGAFLKIDGREALLKSAELFLNRDDVKQIQVVVSVEQIEEAKRKFGPHFGFSGIKLITGGPRWIDQIVAAKEKIDPAATHVIVHDAARPAVGYTEIDALLAEAEKSAYVALSLPLRAGVVETDEGGSPVGTRSADRLAMLLTPMAYSKQAFDAMATSKAEPHASTLTLIKGLATNIRINSAADVPLVSAMIKLLPKPKIKAATSPFEEAQW